MQESTDTKNYLQEWRLAAGLKPDQVDSFLLAPPGTTQLYETCGITRVPIVKLMKIVEIYKVPHMQLIQSVLKASEQNLSRSFN